ncbi:hypothetical protein FRC00_005718, partial [Tulasnella sp. 408]
MAIPLRRCRAVAIPLVSESPHRGSTSCNPAPPSPATQAPAAIAPTLPSEPTPSSPSSSSASSREQPGTPESAEEVTEPPARSEVPPPRRRHYACGPKLCALCEKNWPPIGHKTVIPNLAVATIIRHAMPHRFQTLEQIEEREIATGFAKPPTDLGAVGDGDGDVEYGPPGEYKPPAWTSDRARPKKSCLRKRDSNRFAPYPSPSTRPSLVRRSTKDIKASLDEALANRMILNYEGPVATAIRNEMSAIHIPGVKPFRWQPEYTGPRSETFDDSDQPLSKTTNNPEAPTYDLAPSPQQDLKDKAAVGELTLPRPGKKRQHDEDKEDDEIPTNSGLKTVEGSPPKKQRTTKQLPTTPLSNVAKRTTKSQKTRRSPTPPSPSPTRSTSSSETSTTVPTDSSTSSSDEGRSSPASSESDFQDSSPRKARIAKKKLRFQFSNPSSTHPKFGITDSMYFHHHRGKSLSHKLRKTKESHTYVPATGVWTESEVRRAASSKLKWDKLRQGSLERLTSCERLKNRVKKHEENDKVVERFQKLVDRYEAGWSGIALAGVRARYIRPKKNEVPKKKNKEAMPFLDHADAMREHYPSWDHPAWEGVDEEAIANWMKSSHYKLKVQDVIAVLSDEESERRTANAQPEDATEVASVVDEDEARMRK